MKPWTTRLAVPAMSLACLALAACGGGGVDIPVQPQAQAAAEPLPVSYQLQASDRPLDLGVEGEGHFVLQAEPGGARSYSRFGRLDVDGGGRLIHVDGARVLGAADDPSLDATPLPAVPLDMPARATRRVALVMNLDERQRAHDAMEAFDPANDATFDSATGQLIWFDAGTSHALTLYYRHLAHDDPTCGGQPCWSVHATVDGQLAAARHVLRFEMRGTLQEAEDRFLLPAGDAGLEQALEIDFSGTTNYGAWFNVTEMTVDGYGPGSLNAVTVEPDGRLRLYYSNGQVVAGGQLLLARFNVADRLYRSGGSSWICGAGCRAPALASPGSALLGTIRAGALNTVY